MANNKKDEVKKQEIEVEKPFVGYVDEMLVQKISDPKQKEFFDFYLIVKNPFDQHKIGDLIFKDQEIQNVIDQGRLPNCLKIKRK